MAPEAFMIETLCSGVFGQSTAAGDALELIIEKYDKAVRDVLVLPKEMDSVTQHISLLALFFEAKHQPNIANGLRRLADRLNPGSSQSAEAPKSQNATAGKANV